MLRLNLKRTPRWVDLGHGVRVLCLPVTTSILTQARRALSAEGLIPDIETDDDGQPARMSRAQVEDLSDATTRAVADLVITDWEGVGDENGKPVAVTPEGIAALMDLRPLFEMFRLRVLAPAMLLVSEKNGSAPSPNGTTAGARTTAGPAKRPARTARAS